MRKCRIFDYSNLYILVFSLLTIQQFLFSSHVYGQTKWSGVYGNEWLTGKYGQTWVRIGVGQKGIYKVTLPDAFKNKSGDLHLYHRGIEVALISASNSEIEFYGVTNDGASDALLYRPYTGVRANPYYSWFSDESAYFLTHSSGTASKLALTESTITPSGTVEPYHIQKEITVYNTDYTHDPQTNGVTFTLDQSYYDEGKAVTGRGIYKANLEGNSLGDPVFNFPFELKNFVGDIDLKPKFEVLINSRTNATYSVKSSVGKTSGSLRDYVDLQFSMYGPSKREFTLNASSNLNSSDVDSDGKGVFRWEALTQTSNLTTTGFFSFAYIQRIYPQRIDMLGLSTAYFNFPLTAGSHSRIQITNAPSGARVFDISDPHSPRYIPSTMAGSVLELMAERIPTKELNLVVITSGIVNDRLSSVTFTSYDPSQHDYLVVTNNSLFDAAKDFAEYRNSAAGGSYKSLVVNIKDLYNQFNYGEPSPVAIRRFVDFMVKRAPKPKHNLLLVGPSTTIPRQMRLNRELPDEVPTFGFPGSDVLLVEALADGFSEYATIPVGRISATTVGQVSNYLNKVKEIESTGNVFFWKKKFLHISGGKSASEINQLKSRLELLAPIVTNEYIGGEVTALVKKSFIEVEKLDITVRVNEGVGMISYLGHGSPTTTDLDFGYASDIQNGYNNAGKYPLQYYNGCGVGNIFSGRHNLSPTASDRVPISSDWISAKDKGSIAVIANTYYSFDASSSRYLEALYKRFFGNSSSSSLSIGQIQQLASKDILTSNVSEYDVANIHQSLLQGDPAVRPFIISKPDYAFDDDGSSLFIVSDKVGSNIGSSKSLQVNTIIKNRGLYKKGELVPVRLILYYRDGVIQTRDTLIKSVAFVDTIMFRSPVMGILSRVVAYIDKSETISELSRENNGSELIVDWEKAKNMSFYPIEGNVDNIAPIVAAFVYEARMTSNIKIDKGEQIKLLISDNRVMRNDTSLVDVYLRPCIDGSCDFRRLSFAGPLLSGFENIGNELTLLLNTATLGIGQWQLRVNAKDVAGNRPALPMSLIFEISSVKMNPMLVVRPNPASSYVCFDFQTSDEDISLMEVEIYDLGGRLVKSQRLEAKNRNWYWFPESGAAGIFFYRVNKTMKSGGVQSFTGKVAVTSDR